MGFWNLRTRSLAAFSQAIWLEQWRQNLGCTGLRASVMRSGDNATDYTFKEVIYEGRTEMWW